MNHTQELECEMWFTARIAEAIGCRAGVFVGRTDKALRAERCREVILRHELAARRVLEHRPDTFADCFRRLYGEPLNVSRDECTA